MKETGTKDGKSAEAKACCWAKQTKAQDCPVIDCPVFDPNKDFHRDKTGFYVLVKVDFSTLTIDVSVCDKKHSIVAIFRGVTPQDIYEAIFRYEKQHGLEWFTDKGHMAYLGKELKKAQLALALGNSSYFQE
jgi:hypothetical protein